MASWKTLLPVAASVLGLIGAGCTDTQANNDPHRMTHTSARRLVTGSNVPQAPAYGDGVDDTTSTRSNLGETSSASHTGMGSGNTGRGAGGGGL